jgi:hypothetical protein
VGFYLNVVRTTLVIAGVWLGAKWGVVGISWSLVIVIVIVMFPVHAYLRRLVVGMGWGEFMERLMPFFGASVAAAAVCMAADRWVSWPSDLVELCVVLPAGAAVYAGLLWWRARARVQRIIRLVRS